MANCQILPPPACRNWLAIALCSIGIGLLWTVSTQAQQSVTLEVEQKSGQHFHVKAQYQHRGVVVVDHAGQDSDPQRLPMQVDAKFDYHDRIAGKSTDIQSIRYYEQSKANIKIDNGEKVSQLEEQNRTIVVRLKPDSIPSLQLASVGDALQQSEFELLNNPADPLTYSALLSGAKTEIGSEWTPSKQGLAKFVSVDQILKTNVKLKLKTIENQAAKLYIVGSLKADVNDVSTEMQLSGTLVVDLKHHFVSMIRLNVKEEREAGQVAPGFEGSTKIDIQIARASQVSQLSNKVLAKNSKSRAIRNLLKWKSDEFSLKYEPSWKLIAAETDAAILRYLDGGELLAQCNVVKLASRPASNPLMLEDFKQEVSKIVRQDKTARIIDAQQTQTSMGHKSLQVSVEGEEEGVPLNWVYYNVASNDGRQVTFVFTLEQDLSTRVMPAIAKIVNGFEFHNSPSANGKPASRDAKVTDRTGQESRSR